MDFIDKQIAPPKSWEKFEDLARALFAATWEDPLAQKNGRTGQPQHGVDVFGQPSGEAGAFHGVQCKGKLGAYGARATREEFDEELAKAEGFKPTLKRWIFATTAPNDADLQEHARQVTAARIAQGKFAVDYLGWDSLHALLSMQPSVLQQFYPEHLPSALDDVAMLERASVAALDSIDDALRHADVGLSLLRTDKWSEVLQAVSEHAVVRITGEGGAGKSGILRRLGKTFRGVVLLIKDNRTSASGLQEHLAQLRISASVEAILTETASERCGLCLIDGADRLLMSERRGIVIDLFKAIFSSPVRNSWTIVTTARRFQGRDIVATALREAGFEDTGVLIDVGAIDDPDTETLSRTFPTFAPLLRRKDLAGQNRSLFLLRELLRQDQLPSRTPTEIDIAGAWAVADLMDPALGARRSKALSELGQTLIAEPARRPIRAELDPVGLQALIEEGAVVVDPSRDSIALAHDVHEDWLIARSLAARRGDQIVAVLRAAGEPLWWQRAVRLTAQLLLESEDVAGWTSLLAVFDRETDLDPAWGRAILIAPLYSERATEILPRLEASLLADGERLLTRMLETLIVFETRIDEALLSSPALAHLDETQRYAFAAYAKVPVWRSWATFLRWSLPRWADWPQCLIPRLSEIAALFARATEHLPNGHTQAMAGICSAWLREIEDGRRPANRDNRREPFGISLPRERWDEVEERLREVVTRAVLSAPDVTRSYLERLTHSPRLREARSKLIESPHRVPASLPGDWVDMCLTQFVPRRRRVRSDSNSPFRHELFAFHEYDHSGIKGDQGFFPSSPLRAGFADLFSSDEREALRLFHRLEMRAAVFWRWFSKCHDRKRPLPTVLRMPWGDIALWGDEAVYRWSRGILGSHVLGSVYLALDDWMNSQVAGGRSIEELLRLVLQHNGLVATVAPCIAVLSGQINRPGAIDLAGPFLAEPRLWSYDIRRHIDDQGFAHRIGFWSPNNVHFQAVEQLHQRHRARQPLSHSLLLPFRLMASSDAQTRFDERRASWSQSDLADYRHEIDDQALIAERTARLDRCRSDSDHQQIVVERGSEPNQFKVHIAPPAEAETEIATIAVQRTRLEEASRLANWVTGTRECGAICDDLSIETAISLAEELARQLEREGGMGGFDLARQIGGFGIVGTVAVVARYGSDQYVHDRRQWIESWLTIGATIRSEGTADGWTVDAAVLPHDMQVIAAWGLAALADRLESAQIDSLVLGLAVQRLHAVTEAVLEGLVWDRRPNFARAVLIAALDSCVIDVGHWWRGDGEKRRAAVRTTELRKRAVKRALKHRDAPRIPSLPPQPFRLQWIWTGKWPRPVRRIKMQSKLILDWGRASVVLKRIDWARIDGGKAYEDEFARYLAALVAWTRAYSEEEERRYDSHYPYEWGHELARAIGRFAAAHGRSDDWRALLSFTYHDRAEDLIGDYLDAVARDLIDSGRAADERFWSAWRPAAEWIIQSCIPRKRDNYDSLSQAVRATGFVGPYMTPIPPDWPHLEGLLEHIDRWVGATNHLPSAAYAVLAIVERMTLEQRRSWFLPWVKLFVDVHGANESFWTDNGLGDKTAALLKPLSIIDDVSRTQARQCLAVIADAGSAAAREILPLFAIKRPN